MKKFTIKTKMKNGITIATPSTEVADINEFIRLVQSKSEKDEEFRFKDSKNTVIVKTNDIKSIEIVFE